MNKVILVGNLTRDPELTETPSGVAVCRFAIAVSRDYASSDGTRETDFFNITVWRGRAENCGKYLAKGRLVGVHGSIETDSYTDKDGNRRNTWNVLASGVEFLEWGEKKEVTPEAEQARQNINNVLGINATFESIGNDDIPF